VSEETRIELHSRSCSCRGGAWVLLDATVESPCSGEAAATAAKAVVGLTEWRQAGKPGNLEAFREAQGRAESGERREFQRYEVTMRCRLERIASWRDPSAQSEETVADVIAAGGALVRSLMAVEKGEMLRFCIGKEYETRAEVTYVAMGSGPGMDGIQRLGLKFLDAPLPESLIPEDAKPLE
jgi:hypothetical protein